MKNIGHFLNLLLFLFVISTACPVLAQTSLGDRLFAEGQAFQKKKQYQKAIAKYKAAKVAYTSQEKKQMCDNQIKLCKPKPAQAPTEEKGEEKKKDSLIIEPKHIAFEASQDGGVEISVITGDSSWTFDATTKIYGDESFVTVKKTDDGKNLRFFAEVNNSTLVRQQHIFVSTSECKDTVLVEQMGKPVTLRTSETLLNYKPKGGTKSIDIITNSDSIVADNNNMCWYVESKPDWIEANVEMETQTSTATNIKEIFGKNQKPILSADEKSAKLAITVVPLLKSDSEYATGRKGEVVIASQSKRYKVIVVQQR